MLIKMNETTYINPDTLAMVKGPDQSNNGVQLKFTDGGWWTLDSDISLTEVIRLLGHHVIPEPLANPINLFESRGPAHV